MVLQALYHIEHTIIQSPSFSPVLDEHDEWSDPRIQVHIRPYEPRISQGHGIIHIDVTVEAAYFGET